MSYFNPKSLYLLLILWSLQVWGVHMHWQLHRISVIWTSWATVAAFPKNQSIESKRMLCYISTCGTWWSWCCLQMVHKVHISEVHTSKYFIFHDTGKIEYSTFLSVNHIIHIYIFQISGHNWFIRGTWCYRWSEKWDISARGGSKISPFVIFQGTLWSLKWISSSFSEMNNKLLLFRDLRTTLTVKMKVSCNFCMS